MTWYHLFSEMLKSVMRVMSNLTFVVITFSSVINMVSIAGTISFMPKYFASQYSIPLWKANIIMGKPLLCIFEMVLLFSKFPKYKGDRENNGYDFSHDRRCMFCMLKVSFIIVYFKLLRKQRRSWSSFHDEGVTLLYPLS